MDKAESQRFDNMRVGRCLSLNVNMILNDVYIHVLLLLETSRIFHNHFSLIAIVLLQLIN
jgi:hypothetical protein